MHKLPAMPFYTGDWLKDTSVLSVGARGAWISILVAMWDAEPRGVLSLSMPAYSRLIGAPEDQTEALIYELTNLRICNFLTDSNGVLTLISRRMVRDEKARETNRMRASKHYEKKILRDSNGILTSHSSFSSSFSSSKPKPKTSSSRLSPDEEFEKFWEAYPNKRSKGQAERAWHKLAPDAALVATMLDSLAAQNAEREYLRKNRQFVPEWKHPATWLNGACWNDEVHVDPLAPPGKSVNGNCRKCNFNSTIHALRKCQESKEMFIKKFPRFEAVCEEFEPCR